MTIDISAKSIIIEDDSGELRLPDQSQLSFWGFSSDDGSHYVSERLDEQLFTKVLRYLTKEDYSFVLSKAALKFSVTLEVKNENYNTLKKKASDFKNGRFNRAVFNEFKEFTYSFLKRKLKLHQLKAAFHLYILGNAANFSVPGSGKTSVVLAVYEKLRHENQVNTLFVVCPPSAFGPWRTEFFETLGREPNSVVLAGGNKISRKSHYYGSKNKPELYLTTFQSLLFDQEELDYFLSKKDRKILFVVDEAHYIKQINGNWASAILKQSKKVTYRCVLTGTPMPKSYTDIFNLFDFLWPENSPISSSNKARIKVSEQRGNNFSAKTVLEDDIGALFYRVRKSDLSLSRQNFIAPYKIKMGKYERLIFDSLFRKIRDFAKHDYFRNAEFINKLAEGRIMRLRQCVSYPKLLNSAIQDYKEELLEKDTIDLKHIVKRYDSLETPNKIKFLLKMLQDFKRRKLKVVIWSNFIDTIKLIERTLKNSGFHCKKIFGKTPVEGASVTEEETREKIRDEFVNPSSGLDILIANPAACAESISLHKTCHHAIYYDLSYNCAQYLQSLDRIHRVGGSETIEANYHFLLYENSIDLDIKRNLDEKTRKMLEVIEQDYPIYSLDMVEGDSDSEAYKRIFGKKRK